VTASRATAFFVALLVLLVSLSAEAKKKKKASKKHKTPAAKHTSKSKSKSKSKESDRGLPPPDAAPETDEASKERKEIDEKPAGSSKKAPAESEGLGEDKAEREKPPAPPPEAEEGGAKLPAKPVKPPRATSEPEPESGGGLVALQFGVGGKALFRNLTWNQGTGVPPYSISPGPEVSVWLETFPAAFATSGFAGNIGLYGHFDYGLGASSQTPSGMKLTTKYQDFLAGLKIRIPFGSFLPYVTGAYGMQKFSLDPMVMNLPNFNYTFVSGGAGARVQINPMFDLDLGGAFLYVLNPGSATGEVASNAFYPGATANGVDVGLSIGVRLISMIGVRAGADFRQFGLNTHYKTTDMGLRAGGATDRNISVWGGVEVVFDGLGGGGGEEAAPVKKPPPKAKKPAPREVEPGEDEGAGAGAGAGGAGGGGAGTDSDE